MDLVGIYKITSPSNKVYIGQSRNIKKRVARYKEKTCKKYRKLYNSILEFGFNNHKVEIAHELPFDVTQEVLDTYEKLYMQLYRDCGVELLNLKEGGTGGAHCKETKQILSQATAKTQFKKGNISYIAGKKHTNETKIKMSESAKKRSPNFLGKHHSEEVKEKQRERMLGKVSHMKGKKMSEESRKKLSLSLIGKNKGENNYKWAGGKEASRERTNAKKREQRAALKRQKSN